MTTTTDTINPFALLFAQGSAASHPSLAAAWERVSALLTEKPCTIDGLIKTTGLKRRTVKGLIYHGRKAGLVCEVDTPSREEVTPDLTLFRTVRAYRLADVKPS